MRICLMENAKVIIGVKLHNFKDKRTWSQSTYKTNKD